MECKTCGSQVMYVKHTATHIGLYCGSSVCNKWNSWLKKTALGNYAHLPQYGVHDVPILVKPHVPVLEGAPSGAGHNPNGYGYVYKPELEPEPLEEPIVFDSVGQDYYQGQQEQYYQPQQHQPVQNQQPFQHAEMCVACISGVVPPLEDNPMYSMQYKKKTGMLLLVSKHTNDVVYTTKVKHCPICGVSNGH